MTCGSLECRGFLKVDTSRKISASLIGHTVSYEHREKQRMAIKGRKRSFSEIQKTSMTMCGRPQVANKTKKGITHHKSACFTVRSPDGEVFNIRNILQFIRDHENLFEQSDIEPKIQQIGIRGSGISCNAAKRLSGIHTHIEPQWKGWTKV